jgi:hypothetical protein
MHEVPRAERPAAVVDRYTVPPAHLYRALIWRVPHMIRCRATARPPPLRPPPSSDRSGRAGGGRTASGR